MKIDLNPIHHVMNTKTFTYSLNEYTDQDIKFLKEHSFFDYQCKYNKNITHYFFTIGFEEDLQELISQPISTGITKAFIETFDNGRSDMLRNKYLYGMSELLKTRGLYSIQIEFVVNHEL